jgi:hypothetical protein
VLKPSPRPDPIYVIGDSHAIVYNLRLYTSDDGRQFLFESLYVPGFCAASCEAAEGELSPLISGALVRAGLLVDVDGRNEALHRTQDPHWVHSAVIEGRQRTDPAIVVSMGGLDVMHYGAGPSEVDDIALPDSLVERIGPLSGAPLDGAVPFDEAVSRITEYLRPLADALRELQRHGFKRIALMSLVPPTPLDRAYRAVRIGLGLEVTPSNAAIAWRYKLFVVANIVLARIAAQTGVTFIDRWPDQIRDGVALPGLLSDWTHLSDWAANATALALIGHFHESASTPQEPRSNYQVYVEDPGGTDGLREYTVADEDFVAMRDAPGDAMVLLHDVNERTECWVNRARIVRALRC